MNVSGIKTDNKYANYPLWRSSWSNWIVILWYGVTNELIEHITDIITVMSTSFGIYTKYLLFVNIV